MIKKIILLALFFLESLLLFASDTVVNNPAVAARKRINIFVTARCSNLDWSFTLRLRARLRALFDKGSFFVIAGQTDSEVADKLIRLMKRKNAMIGSIWFDSHGHYGKGHSVFDLGMTGFSYESLKDNLQTKQLRRMAGFFDAATKIGIGSCYGGATFEFPEIENLAARKMNGDSLMIYTSMLFNDATVYASESFVMMKPGVWKKEYALAGYPVNRRFKDKIYLPVWKRLGQWNRYSHYTKLFERINTVCLDKKGDIRIEGIAYLNIKKYNKKQIARLKKLKKGRFNASLAFQQKSQ